MTARAVILAAGMGTRLKEHGRGLPKGFVALGSRPIIEESLLRLRRAGVQGVLIVTGFCHTAYEELASRYEGWVTTAHNPEFANSGSLYSLYCARDHIDADFFLLESDLIYEQRALEVLGAMSEPDVVLVLGPTGAGDEVYVGARDGRLVDMSKNPAALGSGIAGELVGISKISRSLMEHLVAFSAPAFRSSLQLDYETDGLVAAARQRPITCSLVPDLLWAEIDDEAHLERARRKVYPAICARDGEAGVPC